MDVEISVHLREISSDMTISIQGSFMTCHGDIILWGIDRGGNYGQSLETTFLI